MAQNPTPKNFTKTQIFYGKWDSFWRVKPKFIQQTQDKINTFNNAVDQTYTAVNSVFGILSSGISTLKTILSTLENLGVTAFEDAQNPITQAVIILKTLIEDLLNLIDLGNFHILPLFSIQDPYFNKNTLKTNAISFNEFYNRLYFHTIDDLGDSARPIFRDSARVGGVLFLVHSATLELFYDAYKKLMEFFSSDLLSTLSLEQAVDQKTKFLLYDKVKGVKFVNVNMEKNKNNDKLYNYFFNATLSDNFDDIVTIWHPVDFSENIDQQKNSIINFNEKKHATSYTLHIKMVSYTADEYIDSKIKNLNIPEGCGIQFDYVHNNKDESVIINLPKGERGDKEFSFYVDENGNCYYDPLLSIPITFSDNVKSAIPADLDSIPPDYVHWSAKETIPLLQKIYDTLLQIEAFILTFPKGLADQLQDILDAFQLWLDSLQAFLNKIRELLDFLNRINDLLSSTALIWAVYVEGTGMKEMMNSLLIAKNRPPFQTGYYGGLFFVAQADVIRPLANLFGLKGEMGLAKFNSLKDDYNELNSEIRSFGDKKMPSQKMLEDEIERAKQEGRAIKIPEYLES